MLLICTLMVLEKNIKTRNGNPAGIDYYQSHGSTWGSGGRIQIYSMYELGGISTGEYKIRCGHSGATDLRPFSILSFRYLDQVSNSE